MKEQQGAETVFNGSPPARPADLLWACAPGSPGGDAGEAPTPSLPLMCTGDDAAAGPFISQGAVTLSLCFLDCTARVLSHQVFDGKGSLHLSVKYELPVSQY